MNLKRILIKIILFYQKNISVYFQKNGTHCKFYPSCSEYTKQAIEKYGGCRGSWLAIKRLLRCHPWHKGGYDPVP